MQNLLYHIFIVILAIVLAPLLPGIINKVKAFFAGRRGPRVTQLYFDLSKLVKKMLLDIKAEKKL